MINKEDSLLEIAKRVVEESPKHLSINEIAKRVFKIKERELTLEAQAEFSIDFMLSGLFICCGEDAKKHEKVWDLKARQSVSLLDKDGSYLDDALQNDEDVKSNELGNEDEFESAEKLPGESYDDEDEDEDKNETDDISEELGLISEEEDDENNSNATHEVVYQDDEDEDDDEEKEEDGDLEDIVEGTIR